MRTLCVLALAWAAAATVSTDPVSPPAAPKDAVHDCYTREVWTAQKAAWCCEYEKIGCTGVQVPAGPKDEKKPVTLPVEEKPEEKKPVDEKKPVKTSTVDEKKPVTLPVEEKPEEKKPVDEKKPVTLPVEEKPEEKKPVDEKKPVKTSTVDEKKPVTLPVEEKPEEKKPVDEKKPVTLPVEEKPVDEKRPEVRPIQLPADEKTVARKDKFDCRTREVWAAEKSAWCCSEMFVGCGKQFVAEHTKRDELAADAEAKAGKKHRGLRMTVAGDSDEAKTNPRSLLRKIRKLLLDASPVLRKNPSALVVKAFKVGDDAEEVPVFREWNEKLAAEEAAAAMAGSRQALSLQAASAGSDIVVSYDIVAPSATDVDAAVEEVSSSIGAAAVTPREASESHGDNDGEHGDEGVVKTLLVSVASVLGGAALCGLVALTVQRHRSKAAAEQQVALAADLDCVPLNDVEAQEVHRM